MRPARLLVLVMLAALLAGCAGAHLPQLPGSAAAIPPEVQAFFARGHVAKYPQPGVSDPVPVATAPLSDPVALLPASAAVPAQEPAPLSPAMAFDGEAPYTLNAGDKLRIVVFGQDGLSNTYAINAAGAITMPLIGTVPARGLTTDALAHVVAARLRNGFIREPHVAIEVDTYRPFFILGEVVLPGQYPYVPHMTVENAVAIAGGFTPRAYRWDVRIDRPMSGDVVRKTVPPLTRVRPGDTITVKERWF